jgi:hypothetical protein
VFELHLLLETLFEGVYFRFQTASELVLLKLVEFGDLLHLEVVHLSQSLFLF